MLIEAKGLCYEIDGQCVLDNVSFSIPEGGFVGIVGPNGGGKTTLLKLILGLYTPSAGTLSVNGKSPRMRSLEIGYVPQFSTMDAEFPVKVREVVAMGLMRSHSYWPFTPSADKEKANKALAQVGLSHIGGQKFGTLSGGQKQRTLLARALVCDPKLLLLDEPTASVDSHFQNDIYNLLSKLREKMSIVLVSHDMGVVSSLVEQVICVNRQAKTHEVEGLDWEKMLREGYGHDVTSVRHPYHVF